MADVIVNKWVRTQQMNREEIIRFQVTVYCHLKSIKLSHDRLDALTILGMKGSVSLNEFSKELSDKGIYASSGSARNVIDDMQEQGLIVKAGGYRRTINLHPNLNIQNKGTIRVLVDCLYKDYEAQKG